MPMASTTTGLWRENQVVQGSYFYCCDKQHRTMEALRMHLKYSSGCCAYFSALKEAAIEVDGAMRTDAMKGIGTGKGACGMSR